MTEDKKSDKEKLVERINAMPDNIMVFESKQPEDDAIDIRTFTTPKTEEFIRWYFGP